jgi:preprotein translocase subunit SecD
VAPPAGTLRVGRYFLALLILVATLYSIVAFGPRQTPKLGLDLVGGIRVIFTAQTPKGSPSPTSAQMTQARQILEDRINGTGVTGATVVVQGNDQLVVEIPNGTQTDVARLGTAAVLNFRPVIAPAQVVSCTSPHGSGGSSASPSGSGSASPSASPTATRSPAPSAGAAAAENASHAPNAAAARPIAAAARPIAAPASSTGAASSPKTSPTPGSATPSPSATGTSGAASPSPSATGTSGAASPSPSATSSSPPPCEADPFAALFKADPSLRAKMPNAETCPSPGLADNKCKAYSALSTAQQQEIAAALRRLDCASTQTEPDIPTTYYIACDNGKTYGTPVAYLLGHVIVPGRQIDSATAQAPDVNNGGTSWTVSLNLTSAGGDAWHAWTSKFNTTDTSASVVDQGTGTPPCGSAAATPCSDFVGFTLDGQVISAPVTEAVLDVRTSISGNFTQQTAKDLARELDYGKLPVSFRADAIERVSATLGSHQLDAAFVAGGIGLALVVIYSLIYYRGLGLVTIASLIVSAVLIYAMLVILGQQIGFTLDLAGIAGFIVALGITADSFVVFFERIKDEVHGGRSIRVAVPRAWLRARRTILSADTVSFLAAAILYYFASADVKGFAFTLGMSTILDLVVVFLFTHPLVSLLSRSRAFGSPRFTGLNAVRVGGIAPDEDPTPPGPRVPRRRRTDAEAGAGTTAVLEDEPVVADGHAQAEPMDEPPQDEPRSRTAPEPGTAAERAAARRARLRKSDEDGER